MIKETCDGTMCTPGLSDSGMEVCCIPDKFSGRNNDGFYFQ